MKEPDFMDVENMVIDLLNDIKSIWKLLVNVYKRILYLEIGNGRNDFKDHDFVRGVHVPKSVYKKERKVMAARIILEALGITDRLFMEPIVRDVSDKYETPLGEQKYVVVDSEMRVLEYFDDMVVFKAAMLKRLRYKKYGDVSNLWKEKYAPLTPSIIEE